MQTIGKKKCAVGVVRVSSTKQWKQGDSPDDQKKQIEHKAKSMGIIVKKWFNLVHSAASGEQPLQQAIDYCCDPTNDVDYLLIKSIDRSTRAGAPYYSFLKSYLVKYGVQLIDTYGIISLERVNTLAHTGFSYPWSEFSPSEKSEYLEAERA